MTSRTARRRVLRVRVPAGAQQHAGLGEHAALPGQAAAEARADLLAVEEPLEIRVGGQPLAVTMRTPGHDIDLAAGFLATEGVIGSPADLSGIRMCDANVADVTLAPGTSLPAERLRRNFITTSACGVCGKESIDAIRVQARYDVAADRVRVAPEVLAALPDRLRAAQRVFASTGGLLPPEVWMLTPSTDGYFCRHCSSRASGRRSRCPPGRSRYRGCLRPGDRWAAPLPGPQGYGRSGPDLEPGGGGGPGLELDHGLLLAERGVELSAAAHPGGHQQRAPAIVRACYA